mmetsp:Transcript_8825/g.8168  ORF Transcript_8825/g.8168 Transcript_8825/m.8168 type:complete len:414 (-) Transcript_8825:2348-3589(-)
MLLLLLFLALFLQALHLGSLLGFLLGVLGLSQPQIQVVLLRQELVEEFFLPPHVPEVGADFILLLLHLLLLELEGQQLHILSGDGLTDGLHHKFDVWVVLALQVVKDHSRIAVFLFHPEGQHLYEELLGEELELCLVHLWLLLPFLGLSLLFLLFLLFQLLLQLLISLLQILLDLLSHWQPSPLAVVHQLVYLYHTPLVLLSQVLGNCRLPTLLRPNNHYVQLVLFFNHNWVSDFQRLAFFFNEFDLSIFFLDGEFIFQVSIVVFFPFLEFFFVEATELELHILDLLLQVIDPPLLLILLPDRVPELPARLPQRQEDGLWCLLSEILQTLQDLLLLDVFLVEVQRVHLDGLLHGVPQLDRLDGILVVRQHGPQLHQLRRQLHRIIDSLSFGIEDELFGVVFALEGQFLGERFV